MSHSHQNTNLHDARVFHKLTERQGKAWCLREPFGSQVRSKMASQLARMYPQNGCGVCSPTMKLIAHVTPRAELRLLVAPFRVIPISAIANKPAIADCPCLKFWDPEVKGHWGLRSEHERLKHGGHHPMCQYKPTAARVHAEMFQAKNGGVLLEKNAEGMTVGRRDRGRQVHVRPDLMLQVEKKITG